MSKQASILVSNHFLVSSILCVACGCVFITSNYSFGQMMMLSLHLKPSNQLTNWLVSAYMYIFQHFAIHSAIYATVTAILNAEHATGISKSESETHIHFYMITSLNNFLSFSRCFLLEWFSFDGCRFFLCVAFFIRWIAKAESNRIEWIRNLHLVEQREQHTYTKWLFSRANERKTKTKRKNLLSLTQYTHTHTSHIHTFTKSARNHTQHKWYELQNNSIEKE